MRLVAAIGLLAALAIGSTGCGQTATPTQSESGAPEMSQAQAEELWQMLQSEDYATNWSTVPGKGELYRGQDPHGMLLSTYLNEAAAQALEDKPGRMPEDAIIVKENYTPDEALDSVTVMMKQPGFDPDHHDWFWAKYGTEGEIQAAGKPVGCISCHGAVRSNDYVFTFPIAPISAEGKPPPVE